MKLNNIDGITIEIPDNHMTITKKPWIEWISIKDSEPFELRKILVTDGNEICIHYKPFIHAYQTGDIYVFTATGYIRDSQEKLCKCCDIRNVTHWIYLKDIPKP